jgi:hypothetical protein
MPTPTPTPTPAVASPPNPTADPSIARALAPVMELAAALRREPRHAELEARLGTRHRSGAFVPGVSREYWNSLRERLERWNGWTRVDGWIESYCSHYLDRGGEPVRTTVVRIFGSSSIEHVRKQPLSRADLVWIDGEEAAAVSPASVVVVDTHRASACFSADSRRRGKGFAPTGQPDRRWHARVALSRETPVETCELPLATETTRVAIRQRKRFVYDDAWAYDLTLVWEGKTRAEAEARKYTEPPAFHVECELLQPERYVAERDDIYLASSLLMKVVHMLQDFGAEGGRLVPLHWQPNARAHE